MQNRLPSRRPAREIAPSLRRTRGPGHGDGQRQKLHCTTPTPPKPRNARTYLTVLATWTRHTHTHTPLPLPPPPTDTQHLLHATHARRPPPSPSRPRHKHTHPPLQAPLPRSRRPAPRLLTPNALDTPRHAARPGPTAAPDPGCQGRATASPGGRPTGTGPRSSTCSETKRRRAPQDAAARTTLLLPTHESPCRHEHSAKANQHDRPAFSISREESFA